MERCSKCGTQIKNIFSYRGNIYGSECIQNVPIEELQEQGNDIDLKSIVTGLKYAGIKSYNIDEIIKSIPKINDKITYHEGHYIIVLGYGNHRRKNAGAVRRKESEFAIRIKHMFFANPRMNYEGWMYIDGLLHRLQKATS